MERIIPCESKDSAYEFSHFLLIEMLKRQGRPIEKENHGTDFLLSVNENLLTGQYGLHLPSNHIDWVDESHLKNLFHKSDLWIDETFINGENFFAIGVGPLGFGNINPSHNRKILEGNFSKKVISEARHSAREYNQKIQDEIKILINDYANKPTIRQKLLETLEPDKFEELVAELLIDMGFDIFLTPKTRDGGKDIFAVYSNNCKPIVIMVECKRRLTNKTLGPFELRALLGQFYLEQESESNIDYALLVTSAGKQGPSVIEAQEITNKVRVKDFVDLNKWLLNYGNLKNRLWMPGAFSDFFY